MDGGHAYQYGNGANHAVVVVLLNAAVVRYRNCVTIIVSIVVLQQWCYAYVGMMPLSGVVVSLLYVVMPRQ